MPRYKEMMTAAGMMQCELLEEIRKVDTRIDKPLLSKIVNHVVLPTKVQFAAILNALECHPLDIYDIDDITLISDENKKPVKRKDRGGLSHGSGIYNLTVELPREVAERVFSPDGMKLLNLRNRTDCVREYILKLDKRLQKMFVKLEKQKNIKGEK